MKIDEKVQTNVQKIITRTNHLIVSGPKKNIETKTNRTVSEVQILLVIVSFTDLSTTFQRFKPFFVLIFLKLSLILSKTTIVSLIEYQRIVKSAVIK